MPRKRQLPKIDLDFSRSISANILDSEGMVTTADQASVMGWSEAQTSVFNGYYMDRVYQTIPMTCSGEHCRVAHTCPLANKERYMGKRCPVEVIEAFKSMAGYIRELKVDISKHTDIKHIINLVRLDIVLQRLDLEESMYGTIEIMPHSVVQKTGETVMGRVISPAVKARLEIMAEQQRIWKSLLASREAVASMKGAKSDLAAMLGGKD